MRAIHKIIFICTVIIHISSIESYRILGIFPFNGKSHNVMFSALMRGLANRGHQVDDITHFPLKDAPSNYKVVVNLNGTLQQLVNSFTIDYVKSLSGDVVYFIADPYGNQICHLMNLKEMQDFIKNPPNDPPYDLVITEAFGANCFMGFGHLLKVPVIALSSAVEYPWITDFIGNNDNFAVVSNALMSRFDRKNFWDRLQNVLVYYLSVYKFHYFTQDVQTELMRKYLSPDIPNIREVEKSVALTLVNSHPVIYGSKPKSPSLVEVSGLHIEENNLKLPLDLKKWLDEGTDGVVYFTFGSLVLIETLPPDTIQHIYKFINKIAPKRVVMKIADRKKLPPGLPDNVFISPWIPQQAVLAHKNIRIFITHGGLMGCQEALHFGVPMIGVPLFGDQYSNIEAFATKNMVIPLSLNNITSESLYEAYTKIETDPKYRKSMQYYSKLFKDRPNSPMDTAIFWIEFVIRHGSQTLRSPALELNWWQLTLIDVYGFILTCVILVLLILCYAIKIILKKCFFRSSTKQKVQ